MSKPLENVGEDEVDLSNAELFCDSAMGVYIPRTFARDVRRDFVTGVSEEDWKVLEAGPDHEHYWDAWADVLDNAEINYPHLKGRYYLYQEGDLWIVPVAEPVVVLGYTFQPFQQEDWYAFAGAEEGSLICYHDNLILIWHPKTGVLSEMLHDEKLKPNGFLQRDWKFETVLEG